VAMPARLAEHAPAERRDLRVRGRWTGLVDSDFNSAPAADTCSTSRAAGARRPRRTASARQWVAAGAGPGGPQPAAEGPYASDRVLSHIMTLQSRMRVMHKFTSSSCLSTASLAAAAVLLRRRSDRRR
jgi:hypothetical protein